MWWPMDSGWTPVFHAITDVRSSTIFLIGDFDADGVADFERAMGEMADLDLPRVVIDLSDVASIGVAGVSALLRAQRWPMEVDLRHVPLPTLVAGAPRAVASRVVGAEPGLA
jgi:hypothetical protein